MAKERLDTTAELGVTYEHFPDEWRMSDDEMSLLFHEADHGQLTYANRLRGRHNAFFEKVQLAKKYVSQFWAEPIPQAWIDNQENAKQRQIALLTELRDKEGDNYAMYRDLGYIPTPGEYVRLDAGVVSPVALNLTRTLADYRNHTVEHQRFRAIRYMEEAAGVMAAAGDIMAIPQAQYVKFILKKDEDYAWDCDRPGGPVGDYSLCGAPWGLRNGLPISLDDYEHYIHSRTYADFFSDDSSLANG